MSEGYLRLDRGCNGLRWRPAQKGSHRKEERDVEKRKSWELNKGNGRIKEFLPKHETQKVITENFNECPAKWSKWT